MLLEEVRGRNYSNDVDEAKGKGDDSRTDYESPEWKTERFLACCLLVEISQGVVANDKHDNSEEVESMSLAEKRPISGKVVLEDRTFRDEQNHYKRLALSLKWNKGILTC